MAHSLTAVEGSFTLLTSVLYSMILTSLNKGTQVDIVPVRRALVSVSDKTGILEFCTFLSSKGVEL